MRKERIVIPIDNPAGLRAHEVLVKVAMNQLRRAQEAVQVFLDETFPNVEIIDEKVMHESKYWAFLDGGTTVVYGYKTKTIEVIN
ncbi:MAG: hypothetical protein FWE91_08435 [Defluviitaleaceae bacterium]|nr:hypothetical protein [Defluviitaleaceae bacterium]MCL2835285.1 hypothetical protein [Defluviitaleaceae bacterium]